MTPNVARTNRLDYLQAYATAIDTTGRLADADAKNAHLVSEIALLLSAADRKSENTARDDIDRLFHYKAELIRAAMHSWNPESLPHLRTAMTILGNITESPKPSSSDEPSDSASVEGIKLELALKAVIGNLARDLELFERVLAVIEESRFKNWFDHVRLIGIAEAIARVKPELAGFEFPDLSRAEL